MNRIYVLTRGHSFFPATVLGGGPARAFDKGSVVITDPAFLATPFMHFIGTTLQSPTVQMSPAS